MTFSAFREMVKYNWLHFTLQHAQRDSLRRSPRLRSHLACSGKRTGVIRTVFDADRTMVVRKRQSRRKRVKIVRPGRQPHSVARGTRNLAPRNPPRTVSENRLPAPRKRPRSRKYPARNIRSRTGCPAFVGGHTHGGPCGQRLRGSPAVRTDLRLHRGRDPDTAQREADLDSVRSARGRLGIMACPGDAGHEQNSC